MERTHKSAALFLRVDGTLLVCSGERAIEIRLTPLQLLELGMDALTVASTLQPYLLEQAASALAETKFLIATEESAPHHESPSQH